jgi:hypothetical protein
MLYEFPAQYRITSRYKPAFSYMDEWVDLYGHNADPKMFRALSIRTTFVEDYEDTFLRTFRFKAPKDVSDKECRLIIRDHLWTGGCSHDYDCCGCRSAYPTSIKKVGKRDWIATQSSSRNF